MIYQNQLDPSISHIACYYTSIANGRKDYSWTIKELNSIFFDAKSKKYIDTSNCIANPQEVANLLSTKLNYKGKFYTDYKPLVNDYVIGCWKLDPRADAAHFVVMDNSGIYTRDHVIFDPWINADGSHSHTCAIGLCTSLRVYSYA